MKHRGLLDRVDPDSTATESIDVASLSPKGQQVVEEERRKSIEPLLEITHRKIHIAT